MEPYSLLKLIRAFALGLLLTLFFGWALPSVSTTMTTSTQTNPAQPLMDAQPFAKQGRDLYETGHFSEAATAWEQAAQAYQYQGDGANHALALSNLALTYQQLGRWQEAEAIIATSLQQLRSTPDISYAQALDIDGHLKFAKGESKEALKVWQQANEIYTRIGDKAGQISNQLNQAQALQSLGLFLQSEKFFEKVNESLKDSRISSSLRVKGLRSYGEVLRSVGRLEESQTALKESLKIAKILSSPQRENATSATLLSLGNTQRAIAERTREIKAANEYKEAEECKTYPAENKELLDAKDKKLLDQIQQALNSYEEAATTAKDVSPFTQVQAQINQLSLLRELNRKLEPDSQELLKQIQSQISSLPSSRAAIYAQINLAQTLNCFEPPDRPTIAEILKFDLPDKPTIAEILDATLPDRSTIAQILKAALQQAQSLNDKRAESNAIGNLGHLYEQNQQLPEAQKLTQKALLIAQSINAPYITYRWQWQLGRILAKSTVDKQKQMTNVAANGDQYKSAIAVYSEAVETLKSIRSDLLAITQDVQFSFRDNIEPVYRELLALLLPQDESQVDPADLKKAFYYIDSLQVAELENFFRCGLQNVAVKRISNAREEQGIQKSVDALMGKIDDFLKNNLETAIVYPVIVKDLVSDEKRLAVITKVPHQEGFKYQSTSNRETIDETVNDETISKVITIDEIISKVRASQESSRNNADPEEAEKIYMKKLYEWLIPVEKDLKEKVKTIVFIPDSSLRSISMAALYDGSEYLIDKDYAVSVVPSIQLLKVTTSRPKHLNALIAGAKVKRAGFDELSSLKQIEAIKNAISSEKPDQSKVFGFTKVLEDFSKEAFETQIQLPSYNLIHLVTHGQFNADLQTTFILTDNNPTENEDIKKFSFTISDLAEWIQARNQKGANPIELFVLSACQTAAGNSRLVLGLAGIAVKTGTNATLAPLWNISLDSAPIFMQYFYEELAREPGLSKARALQRAQKRLKKEAIFKAPYHWAAYVLVGT